MNTDSFQFLACVDQFPSDYHCVQSCHDWVQLDSNNCDEDMLFYAHCFNGVVKDGKIKDYCRLSCGTCSEQHI